MPNDVQITMIGYAGIGKTTYLVGMYHQMLIGKQGITMRTADPDESRSLEEIWEKIEEGGKDRWPLPNDPVFEEYQFVLENGYEPFMTLGWTDYNGGAIDQLYSSSHRQELVKRLKDSTCVFLAVSGEYLVDGLTVRDATERIKVHRINEFMSELVREARPSHDKPLAVAIVITKYDYCLAKGRTHDQIERTIKALFNPLFAKRSHLLFRAPSFLTAICPVTLGTSLASDKDNGLVGPQGTEQPILFAAWALLRQKLAEAKNAGSSDEGADIKGRLAYLANLITVPVYQEGTSLTAQS